MSGRNEEPDDLLSRIRSRYPTLRKSEKVVADYLREHAAVRFDLSITDFSRVIGVSEATVSRVSRALGYSGFADMKLSMAANVGPSGHSAKYANLPIDFDEQDNTLTIARKLSTVLSRSLEDTYAGLDGHALDTALDAIIRAEKIVFVGVGGGAAVCDEAAHLFLKAGVDAVSYRDGYTQAIVAALDSAHQRTFIGISHTGQTLTVAKALSAARGSGARTIAITSNAESPVGQAAAIVLATQRSRTERIPFYGDFLAGRVCQLFIVNTLYLGLLFRDDGKAQDQLERTMRALQENQ